jgi:hypothetical protein
MLKAKLSLLNEMSMSKAAAQLSEHPFGFGFGFGLSWIWLALGGIAVLIWALSLGVVPLDLPSALTLSSRPHQPETTGFAAANVVPELEIDLVTGTPLTRLGPADLVSGSDGLKHPAPMTKTKAGFQARTQASVDDAPRTVRRNAAAPPKQSERPRHRNQIVTVVR